MKARERIDKRFIWNFLAPLDYFHNNPSATVAASKLRNREGRGFLYDIFYLSLP